MELQVGVKILLKNKEGKYLFLERDLTKYPEVMKDQRWDIPGGRIIPGTPLLENLKREIKEEIQLNLIESPTLIFAQDILTPDRHIVRLTYISEITGEPILDPEENHLNYKWLTVEEAKKLAGLDPYTKEALEKFL